jgi:hypothetical protein
LKPKKTQSRTDLPTDEKDLTTLKSIFSEVKGHAMMDELLEAVEEYVNEKGMNIDAGST